MTDSPYRRELDLSGLAFQTTTDELKSRNMLYDLSIIGSSIRPDILPTHMPGVPTFAVTLEYGPFDCAPADRSVLTVDLDLGQLSALGQTITDAITQILHNVVEASLEHFVAEHPEYGPTEDGEAEG